MFDSDVIRQGIKNKSILNVMRDIDRRNFVSKEYSDIAYDDCAIPLGENQTISQPFIVAFMTENLELKLQIFKDLDIHYDQSTILASNTSSIPIQEIADATQRPQQVIGMHFMNPVPVMKLVEVIRGYATSDEVTERVMEMSRTLGKSPVEVNDYPGFVANRILMPMINEAIITLHEGVAGVEEIDTVMMLGLAHPMGPLHLADFIGLDVCLSILEVMHQGFGNPKYAPCPLLVNMVTAGKLGVKSGEGFYDYSEGPRNKKLSAQFVR